MNGVDNQAHQKFFEWQIEVLEDEWLAYANSAMNILWKEKRLFVGKIWGYEEKSGSLILQFKNGMMPRMKSRYTLCLVAKGAGLNPDSWNFSYKEFRLSDQLSSQNSECSTVFLLKGDDSEFIYIGVNGIEYQFVQEIRERFLNKQLHPIVVLGETDPPYKYLLNLKEFVKNNPDDKILNLPKVTDETKWNPENIDNTRDVLPYFIEEINRHDSLILQGPPGTGKSYLIAQICSFFLAKNLSICVTALTNKALVEVAEKEGLGEWLLAGKVFKTNLSSDERKLLPSLLPAKEISPNKGELLLSTYYKLSEGIVDISQSFYDRFDLLIIEEASQAYLATIGGFTKLAKKVLVVGDHKQLPPVVIKQEEAYRIDSSIDAIIYGFETYAFNNPDKSKRLTKTRRLPENASILTGLFYDNALHSIFKEQFSFYTSFNSFFAEGGGLSIVKLPISRKAFSEAQVVQYIVQVANDILQKNKRIEVALLTPYIEVEKSLHGAFARLSDNYSRITISTIHRIQGLTTDIVILFLPLYSPGFDLNDNLFNVATSRAKGCTLIVTYNSIDLVSKKSPTVGKFLASVEDVTMKFVPFWDSSPGHKIN